jgi:hypothetical protein
MQHNRRDFPFANRTIEEADVGNGGLLEKLGSGFGVP